MSDRPCILVVDDVPHRLRTVSDTLKSAGYEVVEATSRRDALALAADCRPDLLLLSDSLPGAGAVKVCEQLRQDPSSAGAAIILVSDERGQPDRRTAALRAGADGCILQPISEAELLTRVQATLRLVQANRALRQSEERFRVLFEQSLDLVSVVDARGFVLYASPSHEQVLGYSPGELVGENMLDLVHPDQEQEIREALAGILRQPGAQASVRFRIRHKDGSWHWLGSVGRNLLDNPAIRGIVSSSRDISASVRAEEELRESEVRFRAQYKGLPIPVYSWRRLDDDFVLVDYNHAAEEITEGNVAGLLGATASDLYRDAPEILEEIRQCYREGRSFRREMLYQLRSTSETKHLSVSYAFVPPDTVLVHTVDVGERVEAEQALQRLRGELELRVQERTAELERANAALREEVTRRERAQEESERSHQRERVLNALLRISMEEIPLAEQLARALDEILAIPWLPVLPQGAIFLQGEDPQVLELRVSRDLSPAFAQSCARVEFGQCLCGRAAASGRIEFAERVDERHETLYDGIEPHGHYCVPILATSGTIGLLVLYLDEGHTRDEGEEGFLRAVARTLAGMVERKWAEDALQAKEQRLRELNAQLEDHSRNLEEKVGARTWEIEQRRQVAESLRGMLTVLNSRLPLAEILDHIAVEASRLLRSDSSAIYTLEAREGAFVAHTVRGSAADALGNMSLPSHLSRALRGGKPVTVPDMTADPVDSDLVPGLDSMADCCQALLAVPLIVRGEVYGGLVLYYAVPRLVSDEEVGLAVAFADQAALAIENARLHQQARQAAVVDERARLARELHDSVTQSLFSMTLLAEAGQRLASAGELERVQAYLGRLGDTSQQSLKEMRLLVYELRPLALEDVGLIGALQQRLDAVEARSGVEARLLVDGSVEVPAAVEQDLYRIAEQALNNALKHASATSVTARIQGDHERLTLEVVDDGCGFDPADIAHRGGQGLVSMRERAAHIGGDLTVRSASGEGTSVRVEIELPVDEAAAEPV